ncbi:MAG: hypothetical protein AAF928_12710 [Myxococcota bacterium]
MTKKAFTAGSEIDSYCTRCKMDLNHRIIAMVEAKPHKVECLTCRGHFRYRTPKTLPDPLAGLPGEKKRTKVTTRKKKAEPKKPAPDELKQAWEEAIVGRGTDDFSAYRIDATFEAGQLIRHKKFGDGVVSEVVEGGKVQVLFEQGPKILVHGRA